MRSCIGLDHLIHLKTVSLLLPTPFYYIYLKKKKKPPKNPFPARSSRRRHLLIGSLLFFFSFSCCNRTRLMARSEPPWKAPGQSVKPVIKTDLSSERAQQI